MKTQKESSGNPSDVGVLDRLKQAYRVTTLKALAQAMAENESTVKNWNSRGAVPLEPCLKAHKETGRTLDWLILGKPESHFESRGINLDQSVEPTAGVEKSSKQVAFSVGSTGRSDRSDSNSYVIDTPAPLVVSDVDARYPVAPPKGDEPTPKEGVALHSARNDVVEPLTLTAQGQGFAVEYTVIPWHEKEDAENRDVRFGNIAFSTAFMERHFGRREGFELLFARGNSMEPALLDGDEVVINTNVTSFEENGIYALSIRGRVMLRRVQVLPDGSLRISSANQAYEATDVAANRVDTLKIVGRMVWPRVR